MIPYKSDNVKFARELRKNMTPWERKLWYCFLRAYPIRFWRQKPIDCYIADFYCDKARLIVELDGGGHYTLEQMEKDKKRTEKLAEYGIRVIRFCNTDVDENFYQVCTVIDETVKQRMKDTSSAPASGSWHGVSRD